MFIEKVRASELLKSLLPKDQEDLSLLQFIVHCAKLLHRGSQIDLGLGRTSVALLEEGKGFGLTEDVQQFLLSLPEESKRYLHGLSEALEIYYSMANHPIAQPVFSLSEGAFQEIKQIRDMCMDDRFCAIY